ncbi:hypothetical protein Bhyg_02909 [Pseudolycoriella hygida]|uniref:MADF domain-containing protein n=1 Tax=Pseudolycoriella hygida TaxID=35572 RepID=A0A9Q0NDW4_9DIPT|nr:hypothetical protein Bhyg_02909 [Pseudolycoriella hygida]
MDQQGTKRNSQEFDILRLIQEVKKHPILYAKDMKASKESREEAWLKIASVLDTPQVILYGPYKILDTVTEEKTTQKKEAGKMKAAIDKRANKQFKPNKALRPAAKLPKEK